MILQSDQPSRDRIGDWAYTKIRDAILDGRLAPGTRLSVPELAKGLDISRSPARESVVRLLAEGLAKEIPHRGAFVADITAGDIADLYAMRSVLEGLAAHLATDRITSDSEEKLRRSIQLHRETLEGGDRHQIIEADMEFHRLLYDLSANPWLQESLLRLQSLVRLGMMTTLMVPGSPERAFAEHLEILDAVLAKDPAAAETRARSHVDRLRRTLLTQHV